MKINKFKIMEEIESLSKDEREKLGEWLFKRVQDERMNSIRQSLNKLRI